MAAVKAGRYELQEELGRGAMGVVYKAFDPMIGRTVAVKTMKLTEEGSGMARPELVARFQTEARAAGQLVHPNIVIIYDAGENEGLYYITMEYVEGRSLQALIDQKQPFPLPRVMRIMGQVCSALEFAHQRNVVHRDVKPANIVLAADDTVKITDFGTAKILQLGTTQSGTIVGTPSYMSPEQIKGKPIDGRSDVFSLGVILYELVTGEKPFPGESITTVIYKIVNEEPIPPRELDSSVHPGLSAVISRSLAKEPDARYQSCKELMQELLNYRALGGAPQGGPADYGATIVVVGRPSPSAPPPPPEPVPSKTGTLPGAPSLSAPPAALKTPPPAPPPDAAFTPSGASTQIGGPRPMPGASSLPSLTSAAPEKSEAAPAEPRSRPGLVVVLIILFAVGGYLIWPTLRDVVFRSRPAQVETAHGEPAPPSEKPIETPLPAKSSERKAAETHPKETKGEPKAEPKSAVPPAKVGPPAPSKAIPAGLVTKIERQLARAGLGGHVKVEVLDNVVRFTGSPNPRERKRLQQITQRWAVPAGVSVEYAFDTLPETSPEVKPKTAPGKGEVEVLTDVNGATAILTGPDGRGDEGRTPWRFEDLAPGRYTLEVKKEGYRTERRILQVGQGRIKPVQITLQQAMARLEVTSRPAGAEIIVNGKRQGQQTPATLSLPAGSYKIAVQKPGYVPYETSVRLEMDDFKKMPVELPEARRGPGFVDVRTVPPGADILIDGANTGQKTPARIELPAGQYAITIFLRPYPAVRETITVQPGQTLQINKTLSP
ncbi:MAG: PEGA domain-containing protein [Acidobacteria bacterium]|nr:PEGA domain-containing protein [Acidobacteriota bacterium]MBI3662309.1 PEGA domain-containing protein [Acidobacteriota bacterium]